MDMFSREEAFQFLNENLGVEDVEQRLLTDRKGLLDSVTRNMQTQLVFNNIRLLSKPLESRHRPTLDEIKSDVQSGLGGLCYNLNLVAYYLVRAVGFEAALAHCTCTTSVKFPDNHVIVLVRNVENHGDMFLLDAGCGFPTFRVISLDFEKESPIFVDSFLEYKLIRHEGQILRMHRKGELIKGTTSTPDGLHFFLEGWRRFNFADPRRCFTNIDELFVPFDQVFQNPAASPFHVSLRVIGFPSGKAVMVVNDKILIENDQGELETSAIEGGDEGIIQTVQKYFPVLPEELCRKALANWRKLQQQRKLS